MKDVLVTLVSLTGVAAIFNVSMFGLFLDLVRELIEFFRDAT